MRRRSRSPFQDHIRSSFLNILDAVYNADVGQFAGQDDIDRWVQEVTRGKIETMGGGLPSFNDVAFIVTSALYFKSDWMVGFDRELEDEFVLADGRQIQVEMMAATSFRFVTTSEFQFERLPGIPFRAAAIPYEGGRFEMIVVVPTSDPRSVDFLLDALGRGSDASPDNIFDFVLHEIARGKGAIAEETELVLPIFSVDADLDAATPLRNVGVEAAFDVGEFGKISRGSEQRLRIGAVRHKALVEITPSGTVGAAATAIEVIPLFGGSQPVVFKVDRPFLFLVTDSWNQIILFAGKIDRPRRS